MAKLHALIQTPPPPRGEAEQQISELRDYLYTVVEELGYLLTHLEAENIDDGIWERIQQMLPKPYAGLPPMDGDASSGTSAEYARGNHRHPTDTSLVSKEQKINGHALSGDVTVTKGDVGLGDVANERQYSAQNPPPLPTPGAIGAIPTTAKGAAGGVAELDSGGRVPSSQLPSYVDDVLEYPTDADFPSTGETGKIYVAEDTNVTYRWSGSAYVEISASLALGETSSTAYRGDRGKIAYDHSQTEGNPHGTTAAEVGARPDDWTPSKSDIGLGNVENERQYSALNPPPIPDAEDIPYDNTGSGLTASDVQAALDELAGGGGGGGPSPSDANPLMDGTAAPGTSMTYSRSDHVHPADTNMQDKITANGILKGDGLGGVSAATAGTDYQAPLTAGTDYATPGMIPTVPGASSASPEMDGTASAGSSTSWSRGDHIHPKDTSKADLASEIVKVSIASFNSLPKTVSNAAIKSGHEVVGYHMSNQAAMASAWTWTTANGSLTISGTINGSTTLTVYLGLVGTTV